MRLLWCPILERFEITVLFSKSLQKDQYAKCHLRSLLVNLGENWGHRTSINLRGDSPIWFLQCTKSLVKIFFQSFKKHNFFFLKMVLLALLIFSLRMLWNYSKIMKKYDSKSSVLLLVWILSDIGILDKKYLKDLEKLTLGIWSKGDFGLHISKNLMLSTY